MGVNKSTLSRYENGSRKIPMEDIAEIANALKVTP
ncbi:helix-turn-helix domain-containing protein, partial [Staphylococcus aureus]